MGAAERPFHDVLIAGTLLDIHPPPSTRTITATTPPTTPPAPALMVETLLSSPAFSAREPLQRPDPALKLLPFQQSSLTVLPLRF